METSIKKPNTSLVSIAVFVFAIVIVLINLFSVIFPSFILTVVDASILNDKPFELGTWAIPVLVTNFAILIFAILYYTKKLPSFVKNSINFILNFEVSRNVATLVVVGLIFGYVGLGMEDLSIDETKTLGDFNRVRDTVEKWPFDGEGTEKTLFNLHVKNFLLKASYFLFQNWRVVPFIVSISLVLLTYFFTAEITKKRFAGIVAMIVFLQSYTFETFDTVAAYENSWVLFFLLSLYLIIKKWFLSPVSYVASLLSKPLTATYFPMTLFFLYRTDMPRRKKFYLLFSYGIIALLALIGSLILHIDIGGGISKGLLTFDYIDFWAGFTAWSFQLRFESIFLLFILPLTFALFWTSRRGFPHADSVQILIAWAIIAMPLLTAMTTFNLHPYRYVALLDFFAIGVGTLLSKRN